jgi:hypothetical protein
MADQAGLNPLGVRLLNRYSLRRSAGRGRPRSQSRSRMARLRPITAAPAYLREPSAAAPAALRPVDCTKRNHIAISGASLLIVSATNDGAKWA